MEEVVWKESGRALGLDRVLGLVGGNCCMND